MSKAIRSVTVTYHRSYNYGASLQAYALQRTMYSIGFENKILDFFRDPYEKTPLLSGKLKVDLARMLYRVYDIKYRKEKKTLINAFDSFTNDKLILTRQYRSLEELKECPPEADCFFSGSDQVFTVRELDFVVERNLLSFLDETTMKYSYAASLADYNLSDSEKEIFKKAIISFKRVSVRERKAVTYLSEFCNCDFRVDIDPVFLLRKEEWEKILKSPQFGHRYILYFQVNANQNADKVLQSLKKMYGLPIVCIQTNPLIRVKADKVVLDASPEEFLGWIHDADYVVTTSFHGTALSIVFEKEFLSLTKASSNPIRIENMLSDLGLTDRLISSEIEACNRKPIKWDEVSEKLKKMRADSIEYLRDVYSELNCQ